MALAVKNPPANAGDTKDVGLIPGWGRAPEGGHGNPLQYSCLESPHGQRSLAGYSLWGHKESDTTEQICTTQHAFSILLSSVWQLDINERSALETYMLKISLSSWMTLEMTEYQWRKPSGQPKPSWGQPWWGRGGTLWVGANRWTSQRPREPNQPHLNNLRETKSWVLSLLIFTVSTKQTITRMKGTRPQRQDEPLDTMQIMKGTFFYHNSRWHFGEGEEIWNNEFTQRDQANQNYPNKVFEFEQTKSLSCSNYSTWVSLPNETKGRGSSYAVDWVCGCTSFWKINT